MKKWTQKELDYVKTHYPLKEFTAKIIARKLGRTDKAIKGKARNLGLEKPSYKFTWTDEKISILKKDYPIIDAKLVAEKIGCTIHSLRNKVNELGIKKDKSFYEAMGEKLKNSGAAYRFSKGSVPSNKGKKQIEYMTAAAIEKTKIGRFKKGNTPHNTKYDGHERVTQDGYTEVRVKLGIYKLKHRILWESIHGKIKPGTAIIFKDKNKQNITIENLELITRSELARRNISEFHNLPEDFKKLIKLNNKLIQKIKNHEKT